MKYYNLKRILSKNAHYNLIIGERSNGKTYSCLLYGLERYCKYGEQMALLRRWREDITTRRMSVTFDALVNNKLIEKLTDGKFNTIVYKSFCFYLSFKKDEEEYLDTKPFCYVFAISLMEHDKSTSYPNVTTIFFDEFLTRRAYLQNEFVLFCNTLSTIIRQRDNVKIFMCGNTVNQYSPYFNEMGITNIKKMQPGDIDVYSYGDSNLKLAIEFSDGSKSGKPSDVYFAFDNPKLSMITGKGQIWEMEFYPHLDTKYAPKDILFTYFIVFNNECLQCEIIQKENCIFTFIHRKTTPIKEPDNDLVFTQEYSIKPNYRRCITNLSSIERKLYRFFKDDKVFYQDNEVGEIVRNYIIWSKNESVIK